MADVKELSIGEAGAYLILIVGIIGFFYLVGGGED